MIDMPTQQRTASLRAGLDNHLGSFDFAALMLLPLVIKAVLTRGNLFTLYQVQSQDLPILIALPVLLIVLQRWAPAWSLPLRRPNGRLLLAAGVAARLGGKCAA
jgi:hypothetical protein